MAKDSSERKQRGWLAPRSGGYTFKGRSVKSGGRSVAKPPSGSAGVGNLDRDGRSER